MTQQLEFLGKKYTYTSVEDYLSHNRNRGRLFFNDQRLHITYHMVKKCLVAGAFGQQLLPMENNGHFNIIFKESFTYEHDEYVRKYLLHNILCEENSSGFVRLDEAVPLYHVWSGNFWHWTFECLLKILALEDKGYTGKYIVFDSKFIADYLELFNIDKDRICYADKKYIVEKLIVPSTFIAQELPQRSVEYLRGRILDAVGILHGNKRIYVKRTRSRTVINEDEVTDILKKYDFDIIIPEEYSVRDQFLLMTNVDFSVMAHGANCTLTLAQKMNSVFMEFFSNVYVQHHTVQIIKTLNLKYVHLIDERNESEILEKNRSAQSRDIMVPIKAFKALLADISAHRCPAESR